MLVPRQGRRERSYPCDTGATEDAVLGGEQRGLAAQPFLRQTLLDQAARSNAFESARFASTDARCARYSPDA